VYLGFRRTFKKTIRWGGALLLIWFWFCLPKTLFTKPTSPVLLDQKEQLLAARIASDGQWRFAAPDSVPIRFKTSIIQFEDHHFESHLGVHVPSIIRALYQNIKHSDVVSGGSTISMQVIRMSRDNPRRTYSEKALEMLRALRLETKYSKDEIMAMYATHAPMGGNVVGLEAASWRYFKRSPFELSWAEAAMLAVLPNAPSLIHPGRNRNALREKRNRLLKQLLDAGALDQMTYDLSIEEELPDKPSALPQLAMHLLNKMDNNDGKRSKSTLDGSLQKRAEEVVQYHHEALAANLVHNAAALIIDVKNQEVISYIGNCGTPGMGDHVDILESLRSPGSALKPFLYASMLDAGLITPKQLLRDVPINYGGFQPKNFDKTYRGVVPADEALARSLNVPAVEMLSTFGVTPFHERLLDCGFRNLNQPSSHYGLSLILGGGEVTPMQLASAYAEMAQTLNVFYAKNGKYAKTHSTFGTSKKPKASTLSEVSETPLTFSAGALFHTMEALHKVNRPASEAGWEQLSTSRRVAWKTGTSYGFRDAWAVGCTPEYVVLVWVGNADGVGRPGVIGSQAAAPILFDLFDLLPTTSWFKTPADELSPTAICRKSGFRAGRHCTDRDTVLISKTCIESEGCPHHQSIFLNAEKTLRVNRGCDPNPLKVNWFELPPLQTWYYKKTNPQHRPIPNWKPGCSGASSQVDFAILFPIESGTIYLPKDLETGQQPLAMKVVNNGDGHLMHWHLDDEFIGSTEGIHELEYFVDPGQHELVVVNELGNFKRCTFKVLGAL
jgi:penicillin-binding protein 1C